MDSGRVMVMKKALFSIMVLAAALAVTTGCFTSAGARTKKTVAPDGTVTLESDVKIIGTGDKVSQVATEGLFADGGEDDLGAGVKKASASQQSTGIDGTLKGVGDLLKGIAALQAAAKGSAAIDAASDGAAESALPTAAPPGTQASAAKSSEPSAIQSVTGTDGTATVVILGNRASCGYCRGLWAAINGPALSKALSGATVTDADKTENPAAYAKYRPNQSFDWPLALVYDPSGKLAGQFTARSYTQASIESKIKTLLEQGVK